MQSIDTFIADHQRRNAALQASGSPFVQGIAYTGGKIVPLVEATIPMLDQGFLHSDLTYDVPAIWDGRFFRLDDHLDRLWRSLEKIRINSPLSKDEIKATLVDMAVRSGIRDAYVMIIVTRGLRFVRELAVAGELGTAVGNVYLYVMPYVWVMPLDVQKTGGSAVVTRTVRRIPPGAIDPTVKNFQWGDFIKGLFEAADRNSRYPFLPDGDGNLTEGSGFNIVVVQDGRLRTPARGVLEGITRRTVLEIAEANGWPAAIEDVPVDDLYRAQEIFMATTAGGIMPITELDGRPVGDGTVGPITQKVWADYWALHADDRYSFPVDLPAGEQR